jgi:hypothetical protein
MKTQTITQTKRRERVPLQLRVSRAEYQRLRDRATTEGMTFAGWARYCLFKEMRRKPTLAL